MPLLELPAPAPAMPPDSPPWLDALLLRPLAAVDSEWRELAWEARRFEFISFMWVMMISFFVCYALQ